jgi:nucleoside-diphosphate-sugar epimerase
MALGIPCQGFLSVFTTRALLGQGITVFGDGTQLRDPVFVGDVCDSFLRAGIAGDPEGRIINIGARTPISVGAIAQQISRLAGLTAPVTRPFPDELKQIDIGDYYSDGKLASEVLGWSPRTPLGEGLEHTLTFYQSHLEQYLPGRIEGRCPLHVS